MLRHYALTLANAQDASPWNKWSRTVHFPHHCAFSAPEQMEEKTIENGKNPHGSTRNCTPPPAKRGCNLFQRNANCKRAHVCKSFRRHHSGANCPLSTGSSLLTFGVTQRTLPDCDFVNELLHDINFGVRIGFNHDRTP